MGSNDVATLEQNKEEDESNSHEDGLIRKKKREKKKDCNTSVIVKYIRNNFLALVDEEDNDKKKHWSLIYHFENVPKGMPETFSEEPRGIYKISGKKRFMSADYLFIQ